MKPDRKISILPALELKHKFFGPIEVIPLDGKIIIKVPRSGNLNQVALNVIDKYVERLMHGSKHLIHPEIRRALEYHVKREIVMKLDEKRYPESHSLLNKFYEKTLTSAKTDNVIEYIYDLEEIVRRGVLDILLTVYAEIEKKMQSYTPRENILSETLHIFNHILRIATKGREHVSLVHKGTINFGIILVKINSSDSFQHYFRHIQDYAVNGMEMIFVLGAGFINREATRIIAEKFVKKNNEWVMMNPGENEIISLNSYKVKSICIFLKKR